VNSASVGSRTVNNTHESEHRGCSVPNSRISSHPARTLQMSMQSKYLWKTQVRKRINRNREPTSKHPRMKSKRRPQKHHAASKYLSVHQSTHQSHPTSLPSTSSVPKDSEVSTICGHEYHERPTPNMRVVAWLINESIIILSKSFPQFLPQSTTLIFIFIDFHVSTTTTRTHQKFHESRAQQLSPNQVFIKLVFTRHWD
jgi:hypothetical protein